MGKIRVFTGNSGDRELLRLCFAAAFGFCVFFMAGPLVPLLLVELKASPGLLGLVVSSSTIGSLLVAVPGGFLINSWGTRLMLKRSGLLFTVSSIFIVIFTSITGLFIGLFFLEIGKLLFILGCQSHAGNIGEGRDVNHDFGWYSTAAAAGQMAGPAMAGFLIDAAGHRFTWAFIAVLMAFTSIFFPQLLSSGKIAKTENTENQTSASGKPAGKKSFKHYLSAAAVIAIISSFAVIFADGTRQTFYPVLLRQFGYSASVIGLFMSLSALMSVSVRFFMPHIIKAAGGRFQALIISILVLAFGIGVTPFCTNYFLLAIQAVFVGTGMGLALPLSMATVSAGVKPKDRGVAMGIRLTGNRLAKLTNPLFFGFIAQTVSLGASFIAGGFLLFASAIPIIFWWKREKRSR